MSLKARAYRDNSKLLITRFKLLQILSGDSRYMQNQLGLDGDLQFELTIFISTRATMFDNREELSDALLTYLENDNLVLTSSDRGNVGLVYTSWHVNQEEKITSPRINKVLTEMTKGSQGVKLIITLRAIPWLSEHKSMTKPNQEKHFLSAAIEALDFKLSCITQNKETRDVKEFNDFITEYKNSKYYHFNSKYQIGDINRGKEDINQVLFSMGKKPEEYNLYPVAGGAWMVLESADNSPSPSKTEDENYLEQVSDTEYNIGERNKDWLEAFISINGLMFNEVGVNLDQFIGDLSDTKGALDIYTTMILTARTFFPTWIPLFTRFCNREGHKKYFAYMCNAFISLLVEKGLIYGWTPSDAEREAWVKALAKEYQFQIKYALHS